MPVLLVVMALAQAGRPAAAAPPAAPAAAGASNVAFCFVRDETKHDYLTPAAPEGTELEARFSEWLKATLPNLPPERLTNWVQCHPSVPRTVYDHWFGWSHLSSGDVFSEPFKWPADWYLRHPGSAVKRPR